MKKRLDIIFVVVLSLLSVGILLYPNNFKHDVYKNSITAKARVISVDNDDLHKSGLIISGVQLVTAEVLNSKYANDTITVGNNLVGQLAFDKLYKADETILLILNKNKLVGSPAGYYRLNWMLVLTVIFVLFLIAFSGFVGVKTVLSFFFTIVVLWKILVPLLLQGYNPWIVSISIIVGLDFIVLFLANGFRKVGVVTFLGSIAGILTTAVFSSVFGSLFKITGAVKEYSEPLYYNGFMNLSLTQIFLTGIFISASGAIMDICTDVAASQNEVCKHKGNISVKELIKSGFDISKPVISTMSTTLLFAYVGSNVFLFMLMFAEGHHVSVILNSRVFSAHVLQILIGSFGVIISAPLTAIVGGFIFTHKKTAS